MDYFEIAGITVQVEWEDESGKKEFYNKIGVRMNPPFLGAYELSDEQVREIEQFDMSVHMRMRADFKEPEKCVRVANLVHYKENGNLCVTFLLDKYGTVPVLTIKTKDKCHQVEFIPHEQDYNVYSLQLLQAVFQQYMVHRHGCIIHGAAIEYQNQGIIFSAFSGTGKTTQARLWRKYRDAIVINGDSPILRKENNEVFMYGSPWCGTSGESINRKVPLKAIVLVNRATENRVEEVTGDDAILAVYTNILYFSQDEGDLDNLLGSLTDIVKGIKVYKLFCNMEEDAVATLERAIYSQSGTHIL